MNNQEPNGQKPKTIEDMGRPERPASSLSQRLSIQNRPVVRGEVASNEPIVDGMAAQPPSGPPILRAQTTSTAPATTTARNNNLKPIDQNSSTSLKKNDVTGPAVNVQPGSDDNLSDSATEASQAEENTTPDEAQFQEAMATTEIVRRERELQEYIKNRKYFIPVNIAGYKRSVKVSLWLVLLVILLGVVLIDLMLDSGMIYLVQNVPHTHFFNYLN
jgi:hypothetical protein